MFIGHKFIVVLKVTKVSVTDHIWKKPGGDFSKFNNGAEMCVYLYKAFPSTSYETETFLNSLQ